MPFAPPKQSGAGGRGPDTIRHIGAGSLCGISEVRLSVALVQVLSRRRRHAERRELGWGRGPGLASSMSMLNSVGLPGVTSTDCRRSPRLTWRTSTSRGPTAAGKAPSGAEPMRSPSTKISAPSTVLTTRETHRHLDRVRGDFTGLDGEPDVGSIFELFIHQRDRMAPWRQRDVSSVLTPILARAFVDVDRDLRGDGEYSPVIS